MKRSEINATIKKMEALLDECRFKLPPYLYFTPEEWADKNHEYDEIRECELGWDVTDYGEGKFDTLGLALITIRNGNIHNPKYPKTYAEKIMMCDSGQVSPMHYHENKREDIINRGGNDVVFTFYNATSPLCVFSSYGVMPHSFIHSFMISSISLFCGTPSLQSSTGMILWLRDA